MPRLARPRGRLLTEPARATLRDVAFAGAAFALLAIVAGLARLLTQGPFPWN